MQIKLINLTSFPKFLYSPHRNILFLHFLMKKVSIMILGLITAFFIFPWRIHALSVSDLTPALDKKVAKMKTTEEKVKYLKTFSNSLANPKFSQHKDAQLYKDLREYSLNMLRIFEDKLKEEQTKSSLDIQIFSESTINLPHLSDNFSNIDEQKVRNAILSRHNEKRNNIWVNPYKYNLDLEWSATIRANKLADSHKTSNLHLRNNWDWYYNYNSMLNRFSSLWINFPKSIKWAASFSESVWYGYYKCSKYDCTQDLIDALKKTRTWLIIKERTSNGSHYRAATMKHFTQIWAWIAIDKSNNRYYLVLHYGVNF